MATPPHIAEALQDRRLGASLRLAEDDVCIGAKFHSPSPLVLREVDLVPWSKKITGETVWLCGTCADNLAALQHIIKTNDGNVPWETRREFGNQVRALGLRGWNIYAGSVKGSG